MRLSAYAFPQSDPGCLRHAQGPTRGGFGSCGAAGRSGPAAAEGAAAGGETGKDRGEHIAELRASSTPCTVTMVFRLGSAAGAELAEAMQEVHYFCAVAMRECDQSLAKALWYAGAGCPAADGSGEYKRLTASLAHFQGRPSKVWLGLLRLQLVPAYVARLSARVAGDAHKRAVH